MRYDKTVERRHVEQIEECDDNDKTHKPVECRKHPYALCPCEVLVESEKFFCERNHHGKDDCRRAYGSKQFPESIVSAFRRDRCFYFARGAGFSLLHSLLYFI